MSKQARLTALMTEGATLMPSGMGATFRPVPSGKVWGGSGRRNLGALVSPGNPIIPRDPGGRLGATPPASPRAVAAAKEKFAAWVRAKYPELYAAAERRVKQSTNLGADESWLDKLTNAFTSIAPEYLRAKAQRDLLDVQLERAKQGLPPLNTAQYAPAVQVSVDPQSVRDSIATGAASLGEKLGPLVWIVPAAVVGFLLLRK